MRSANIEDLPFPVGTLLNREQIEVLKRYNAHDVTETKRFYHHTADMLRFREEMVNKYPGKDWINYNDTKNSLPILVSLWFMKSRAYLRVSSSRKCSMSAVWW